MAESTDQASNATARASDAAGLSRVLAPVRGISDTEKAAAALLLVSTVAALGWANWPRGDTYHAFWHSTILLRAGDASLELDFRRVVNDALMTLFFFVVGLEVKREFTIGELSSRARAIVPVFAALAGLAVPALIFLIFNPSGATAHAWGVVISTDTAFLLGALAVAGPKFPGHLRVFLLALAVVDDVGALAVIAMFYTERLAIGPLALAAIGLVLIGLLRYLPAGQGPAYLVLSVATWGAMFASGVHPTLAGVAIALLIPVYEPSRQEVERAAELSRAFRQSPNPAYARAAARSLTSALSINERLQDLYSPYTSFVILPIFALANAGVILNGETLGSAMRSPVTGGIVAGLVFGKVVGILGMTALMQRLRIGTLAPSLGLDQIAGGAALSGIGFTISLFITDLAIDDPLLQDEARVGVLIASVVALVLGWAVFRIVGRLRPPSTMPLELVRPVDPERDHIRGRVDAPLTLVEYGDFECPFCSRATGSIDDLQAEFGDELRYVWRHLPLTGVHPHSLEAAYASEAAGKQGMFFAFGEVLFRHQDALESEDLIRYAVELGLDPERFESDMRSGDAANRVRDDMLDAELMDIHGTPTFFIGTRRHKGPYDAATLARALRESRDRSSGAGAQ